ncbi:MAG TPA: T9SS type A sorting domain-containing protein [Flavobacterium sp.]|nr:T9SS type A sorting domain-containing protein [Flavobacterium sp.]
MKKRYFIIWLLFGFIANAQIVNIPDTALKNALVNTVCSDTDGDLVADADVDTDNDGEIQMSEALAVTALTIENQAIANLIGLENFSNVTYLSCGGNQIASLSLAGLASLTNLYCNYNDMTALDLSGAPLLYRLNCSYNNLTNVYFSGSHQLYDINCEDNNFSSIDVCGTAVEILWCSGNPNLTYFSIKNNVISNYYIGRTNGPPPLPSIWFDECPLLTEVCIDPGEEMAITSSWSNAQNILLGSDCNCTLGTQKSEDGFDFTVTPNPATEVIAVNLSENVTITKITIYDVSGKYIKTVSGQSKTIVVGELKTGTYFIEILSDNGKAVKKFIKQ